MAGSGWCHHPLRKTTSDLLIMVRGNELACRDAWSHSLWEEGVWRAAPAPGPADGGPPAGRPLAPATDLDIAAVLRADGQPRPTDPVGAAEDVVLGEARLVSDRTPPWRRPEPATEPLRDHDPRAAVRRAREAFRERRRAEAEQARLADRGVDDSTKLVPLIDGSPTDGTVELAADRDTAPIDIPAEATDLDDARAHLDPDDASAGGLPLPGVAPADGGDSATAASFDGTEAEAAADGFADDDAFLAGELDDAWWAGALTADDDRPTDAGGVADDAVSRRSWAAGDERADAPGALLPGLLPGSSPWSVASGGGAGFPIDDGFVEGADDPGWAGSGAPGHEPWDATFETVREYPPATILPAAGVDAFDESFGDRASAAPADVPEHGDGGATDVPAPVGPLLPVGSVAPGVPRICRTCRDFRPGDGGERGWCANEWAFTARRMVRPDEPAACESSIGSWWLPTDDLCLADADVSTHGQPTPTLDRWLPGHREPVATRRRS
jgi:hypothetical protein